MRYTPEQILEHVQELHYNKEDFEDGDIEDRIYQNHYYSLKEVLLSELDADSYYIDEDRVADFVEKESEIPVIVLNSDLSIIDGSHRIKSAKLKGNQTISAYIGYRLKS